MFGTVKFLKICVLKRSVEYFEQLKVKGEIPYDKIFYDRTVKCFLTVDLSEFKRSLLHRVTSLEACSTLSPRRSVTGRQHACKRKSL